MLLFCLFSHCWILVFTPKTFTDQTSQTCCSRLTTVDKSYSVCCCICLHIKNLNWICLSEGNRNKKSCFTGYECKMLYTCSVQAFKLILVHLFFLFILVCSHPPKHLLLNITNRDDSVLSDLLCQAAVIAPWPRVSTRVMLRWVQLRVPVIQNLPGFHTPTRPVDTWFSVPGFVISPVSQKKYERICME